MTSADTYPAVKDPGVISAPIHLLILHMAYGYGGAEQTTANLLRHLNRTRIRRVTLVAPGALRAFLPENYDSFVDASAYGLGGGFENPKELFRQARIMGEVLRELKPHVALGMMHFSSALVVLGSRISRMQTRLVASYRGPFFEHMRHHESGFRRWIFLWTVVSGVARMADRVLVPSRGTALELRSRFLVPTRQIRVIPNGIDLIEAEAAGKSIAEEIPEFQRRSTPVLCAIARLAPEKNLGLLLEAFRQVCDRVAATLLIIGDGPERDALERRVRETGLAGTVRFIGYRANVMPYLLRSDLFIHTCLFEGFGYTLLEALACRTVVVATDCPYGPREVLAEGECGCLVPMGDPTALANAILELLRNPSKRLTLASKGYARAKELSVSRMVKACEQEFLELAAK